MRVGIWKGKNIALTCYSKLHRFLHEVTRNWVQLKGNVAYINIASKELIKRFRIRDIRRESRYRKSPLLLCLWLGEHQCNRTCSRTHASFSGLMWQSISDSVSIQSTLGVHEKSTQSNRQFLCSAGLDGSGVQRGWSFSANSVHPSVPSACHLRQLSWTRALTLGNWRSQKGQKKRVKSNFKRKKTKAIKRSGINAAFFKKREKR